MLGNIKHCVESVSVNKNGCVLLYYLVGSLYILFVIYFMLLPSTTLVHLLFHLFTSLFK